MRCESVLNRCAAVALALLLGACGGGGSGSSSTGDIVPGAEGPPVAVTGPNSFLLFPNPILASDGTQETNTLEYARAYYAAIDPLNQKDTLVKWKLANGMGTGGAGTFEETVAFGDKRDLGYGRRMTARKNADGTLAFMVENYLVDVGAGYGYSTLNLDAAVSQARKWHIGTNAIEFSPGPSGGVSFVKFYTFDPATGQRALEGELDGRGNKAMPGICITCHGGRGDPLTAPDAQGKRLFPLVAYAVSQQRGDVQARLHSFELDAFDFSAVPGFTRAELEPRLKNINKLILCSYPLPEPSALPEDQCRRSATVNEYQGTAALHLKAAYGGPGLPNATFRDNYIEQSWLDAGQSTLYRNVQVPACRVCHALRGTGNQSDIDFTSFDKFDGYSDRIKAHMVDRGNMPLAKLIAETFYSTPASVSAISGFLLGKGFADGAMLPGRPVADPGPDRVVKQGTTTLSALASLYAASYQWSIASGPDGAVPATNATLANASSAQPVFNASSNGTYVLKLTASTGAVQSAPATLRLVVNNALAYTPSALRFAQVKAILQSDSAGCKTCHNAASEVLPPIYFIAPDQAQDIDRNGDGRVDGTDNQWFHAEVRGRINFTDIGASPLLRKPSGNHHNGGLRSGFNAALSPGQDDRKDYDLILNWALNGAPY